MTATTRPLSKASRFWREWRGSLAFLFFMLVFRSAWADWMHVPTGSMNPTIVEGDRIVVDKHVYGFRIPWTLIRLTDGRDPRRGEIVVFDSPTDGTSLVKRVIGEPGDVVSLDGRGLVINGHRARYAPGDAARLEPMLEETRARRPRNYRESGILPEHDVLDFPYLQNRDFGPVQVPEGAYLMLGDNRDNSADSRFIGFVPRKNIVGRATSVPISFDPENWYLPRGERWFEPLE
jgi:signal peptidase I